MIRPRSKRTAGAKDLGFPYVEIRTARLEKVVVSFILKASEK